MSFQRKICNKYTVVASDGYPLFRVQNTKHFPKVKTQPETDDPAGIYFFYKEHCPEGGVYWNDWKYTFEARFKTSRILNLGKVDEKTGLAWVLDATGKDDNETLEKMLEHAQLTDNWEISDDYDDLEAGWTISNYLADRPTAWFHLLKSHFQDSKKFAQFFISKGYDVLEDHAGIIWSSEEHQCLVLKNEAVEIREVDPQVIIDLCGSPGG